MSHLITIQTSEYADQIIDGEELTKMPYPITADETGRVEGQPFIDTSRVIGFQRDLAVQSIDLRWADAVKDPQQAVGMYVVTQRAQGTGWATWNTAVAEVTVHPAQT
jgi:hypothetical protein